MMTANGSVTAAHLGCQGGISTTTRHLLGKRLRLLEVQAITTTGLISALEKQGCHEYRKALSRSHLQAECIGCHSCDVRRMQLTDGRKLAWAEMGDAAGYPVFVFHGTPGSHRQILIEPAPALAAGARVIAPDRPGCGASTWQRQRTFAGWTTDIAELADHLGIERFAVLGISGGGPHAAACAHFLPDRVSAAALVSGVGSLAEPGSEAGMMPANRLFARLARKVPGANNVLFGLIFYFGRRGP